jgi:cobalamin biosynthesis Mg chelatase CobN
MMDPKLPDEPAAAVALTADEPTADDPAGVTPSAPTAPQLSAKLRKQAGIADDPAKPIHIKKLDELAETASNSEETDEDRTSETESEEEPEQSEEQSTPEEELPEGQDDADDQSTDLDNEQTDKAVDDIVAYEGDVMLAVADSTAEARNEELSEPESRGHPVLSTIFWVIIALLAILIVLLLVLMIMGDSLADKLGL